MLQAMRKWTEEERRRQAELIRSWQPWRKAGVKTQQGKAKSRMNALKHGLYGMDTKVMRLILAEARANLKRWERQIRIIRMKNKLSALAEKIKSAKRINMGDISAVLLLADRLDEKLKIEE